MVRASSINVDRTKIIGLMLANGLIGLSGALSSQSLGYSDVNTANGTLIYGLLLLLSVKLFLEKEELLLDLFQQ